MKCFVCGSKELIRRPTVMSGFLCAKISGGGIGQNENERVFLCHCKNCSFSFYDRRLTEEEAGRLYKDYRGEGYQKLREKYDCWYTVKVNNALNNDVTALKEQKRIINKLIKENIQKELKYALDFGGNRGESFTKCIGTVRKCVYDISGVKTVSGVERICDYKELLQHSFDFIMCNMTLEHVSDPALLVRQLYEIASDQTYLYAEVPSENPFQKNKFSVFKNLELMFNPYYSCRKLIKHYFHLRKQPYMPMTEHINFFTPKAFVMLMTLNGFEVIDVQENYERGALGKGKVLSILCRKRPKIL